MRIDLCLNRLCLFKTRSQAGRACDEGRVWLNGQPVRSSREVHPGDIIRFQDALGRTEREYEILAVPEGSVSKTQARDMVRLIAERFLDNLP